MCQFSFGRTEVAQKTGAVSGIFSFFAEKLAHSPAHFGHLNIARRKVVEHAEPRDGGDGVLGRSVEQGLSEDGAQLDLDVQILAVLRVVHRRSICVER